MGYDVSVADLQRQDTAVVSGHASVDGISDFLGRAFGEVMTTAAEQGVDISGPPFGRYLPREDGGFDIEAGFPTSDPLPQGNDVEAGELPGGRVARTVHRGAWDQVHHAYQALMEWTVDHGYVPREAAWESYLDGPGVDEPRTEVFLPVEQRATPAK